MKIKHIASILLLLAVLSYLIFANKSKNVGLENDWKFEKTVGQTLYFSNNKQFKVDLYNVNYIGQLHTESNQPLFILSGRGCTECDENIAIYIYSPTTGLVKENNAPIRYSYPGKEFDYMDNKLTFESRMFYGKCLDANKDSIVWFQKEFNKDGTNKEGSFVLEVIGENIKESIIKDKSLSVDQISQKCNELPGVDVTTEP